MSAHQTSSIDDTELANKIVEANSLEIAGEIPQAIAIYREILKLDRDGNYGAVARQALSNLRASERTETEIAVNWQADSWWAKLSLKTKTTVVLLGISVLSAVGVASLSYFFASHAITSRILDARQERTNEVVATADDDLAFAAQKQLLLVFAGSTLVVTLAVAAIAALVSDRVAKPIVEAAEAVKRLGRGDLNSRLAIRGRDELAELRTNINQMASQLENLLIQQETEAQKQRREKENLQKDAINLLLDVESAKQGDLTVQARMSDEALGSLADAFNATINKLRDLLSQVRTVANEVGQLSLTGESSVRQLSEAALNQAEQIDYALNNIAEINDSVQKVADFAREAAQIARLGRLQAQEGDTDMQQTVKSINKIRTTVANTSKKVKQLAESSQEIGQIVDIISGISEKTNVLAFNASVEAARAGEHGEGFKIVAEEVRRLADRIIEATKDIKQLVSTIQIDTTAVLQGIESGTTEVVTGSDLIYKTQETLKRLADTNSKIDEYLQSISFNTTEQTSISQQVKEKITGIASIARNNSVEAKDVVKSLHTLVAEAEMLQASISQFKLNV